MSELVIRPATPDDWPLVAELGTTVFAHRESRSNVIQAWMKVINEPGFRWDRTRLGLVNGQIVAHVNFVDRVLRYGQAELTFGGISGVYTHPDFRGRGYSAALMADVLRAIERRGYHLSLLEGIPRYYDRFGYVSVWMTHALKFDVREAQRVPDDHSGYQVRPATPDDLPAILALYEDEWSGRPWSARRSLDWLHWRLDRTPEDGSAFTYVVEDRAGKLRGYSCGWRLDNRTEVVVADRYAVAALLRHTAAAFAEQPDTVVTWLDAPNSRAGLFARHYCTIHYHTGAVYRGGWMGRFVHIPDALEILRPEFVARLQQLGIAGAADAAFEAQPDCITIRVGPYHIRMLPSDLLQLMFGYFTPEDIDTLDSVGLTAQDRHFLKCLFPPAVNTLAGLDWF